MHSRQEAALEVVRFLATQVGVDATLFAQYLWEGRTIEAHRAQIREITKVREFRRADEEALLTWLCADILPHEQHPERLRELGYGKGSFPGQPYEPLKPKKHLLSEYTLNIAR